MLDLHLTQQQNFPSEVHGFWANTISLSLMQKNNTSIQFYFSIPLNVLLNGNYSLFF